jgi:hypothetical protein
MAASILGALRVVLGLDSANFVSNAKKAKSQAQDAGTGIAGAFRKATESANVLRAAVATLAGAAVVTALRSTIDSMDELSKAAQKVGTSAPDLAKLRHAADLSGVSAEGLQTALNKLNRAIVTVGPGAKGAAAELQRLGVTAKTGTLDAMMKVADEFAAMPDGAAKSAKAIELFGKAGADMIPLLNGGSAAMKAAADDAERLGLVIDAKTLQAAEAFNDSLTDLGKVVTGVQVQIAAGMVPALAAMTTTMARTLGVSDAWVVVGQRIGQGLVFLTEKAFMTYDAFAAIARAVASLAAASTMFMGGRGIDAALREIRDTDAATAASIKARAETFAQIRKDIANFKPGEKAGAGVTAGQGMAGEGAARAGGRGAAATPEAEARLGILQLEQAQSKLVALGPLRIISAEQMEMLGKATQHIGEIAVDVPQISKMDIFRADVLEKAERFSSNLAANLSQALVFGQSLGKALVSSIKAAAAEMIASRLFKMLGGIFGKALGLGVGIPGFANGTRNAPGGLAMVGERGRELVQLPRGARVMSNPETERALADGRQQPQQVVVSVNPSPLFAVEVVQGASAVARAETQSTLRKASRPRMMSSMGA